MIKVLKVIKSTKHYYGRRGEFIFDFVQTSLQTRDKGVRRFASVTQDFLFLQVHEEAGQPQLDHRRARPRTREIVLMAMVKILVLPPRLGWIHVTSRSTRKSHCRSRRTA